MYGAILPNKEQLDRASSPAAQAAKRRPNPTLLAILRSGVARGEDARTVLAGAGVTKASLVDAYLAAL